MPTTPQATEVKEVKIKDGDFIVILSRWSIDVQRAIKITAQFVFYKEDRRETPRRVRIDDVVFSGPEPIARKLVEQLKSSDAQKLDDDRAAYQRHQKRNEAFIAKAAAESSEAA